MWALILNNQYLLTELLLLRTFRLFIYIELRCIFGLIKSLPGKDFEIFLLLNNHNQSGRAFNDKRRTLNLEITRLNKIFTTKRGAVVALKFSSFKKPNPDYNIKVILQGV